MQCKACEVLEMSNSVLEKKLCTAKVSPEPIFDLSECNLKQIPDGIYTLIKVLRKECLYLQSNKLTLIKNVDNLVDLTLLKLLDISSNKIAILPPNIQHLRSLQILKADNNELSSLPAEIGNLLNLEYVSLSSNKLKTLPDSIGRLKKLSHLDIRRNAKLRTLPVTLYQNKCLQTLFLDEEQEWSVPPKIIVRDGVHAILNYFAGENNITDGDDVQENIQDANVSTNLNETLEQLSMYDQIMEDNLRRLEKEKDRKSSQKIKTEKIISDQREKELLVHQQNQNEKQKLLENLVVQQQKIDETVLERQKQREKEQSQFIRQVQSVENIADEIIQQLIKTNNARKMKCIESLASSLTDEFVSKQNLHCQEVLESMEILFAQEYSLMKKIQEISTTRRNFINFSNLKEAELKNKIVDLLSKRENKQNRFLSDIKEDTELQYTAVLMLIEKSDYRNIELQNQISLVQNQLSDLTALELKNQRLNTNKHINELAERRTALSELLFDIFTQQQTYKNQLIEKLVEAENRNYAKNQKGEYWLIQYQRLLDQNAKIFSKATSALDPLLIYELALFGVSHCGPFLSMFDTKTIIGLVRITDKALENVGMISKEDREAVLIAIKHYTDKKHCSNIYPSAPPLEDAQYNTELPTAPMLEYFDETESNNLLNKVLSNECAVCLSTESDVIFFPCGHFCSCTNCSLSIDTCPLCRCDIKHKLRIFNT